MPTTAGLRLHPDHWCESCISVVGIVMFNTRADSDFDSFVDPSRRYYARFFRIRLTIHDSRSCRPGCAPAAGRPNPAGLISPFGHRTVISAWRIPRDYGLPRSRESFVIKCSAPAYVPCVGEHEVERRNPGRSRRVAHCGGQLNVPGRAGFRRRSRSFDRNWGGAAAAQTGSSEFAELDRKSHPDTAGESAR